MLTTPTIAAVTLPQSTATGPNTAEWLGGAVVVVGDLVCCDRGFWTADDANAIGTAMVAGALTAGATHFNGGGAVVALPAPSTPAWGEPGFVYYVVDDTYVAVNLSAGSPGTVWVGDDLMPADAAWGEGLAIIAAARATLSEAAA